MMPMLAVATLLSTPALPVEECGMRSGQFRVGIVIAPASGATRAVPVVAAPKKPVVNVVPVGVSTMHVYF